MASPSSRAVRHLARLTCGLSILAAPALASAAGANPETASASEKSQAQTRYLRGVKEYKAGDYEHAAQAFKSSYEIVASPNSHMMFARALREAGHFDQAYEEFALTQNEAGKLAIKLPRYATAAESAEAEKKAVLKKVAAISVEVDGDPSTVTLYVGSRQVPEARWRAIAVKPGSVDVTARLAGGRRVWRNVTASIGHVTRVQLDVSHPAAAADAGTPHPAPVGPTAPANATGPGDKGTPRQHPLRRYAYVAGGVGVAGLLTFTIAGAMSRSTYNDLSNTCSNNVCPPAQANEIDKGKTEQTIANVGLAVGIAGAAAGIAFFVIDLNHPSPRHDAARHLDLKAGPGSVSVEGTF